MLTQRPTQEIISQWKSIFTKYRPRLKPNRKTAEEVIEYLTVKYPLAEIATDAAKRIVVDNITMNKPFAEKLPPGKESKPIVYTVLNQAGATSLYSKQEDIFRGRPIMVGIELETACVLVEGSGELADELVAFQGLDDSDLHNYYLVANYIMCLQKYNMLDSTD